MANVKVSTYKVQLKTGLTHRAGENELLIPYKVGDIQSDFGDQKRTNFCVVNGGRLLLMDTTDTFGVTFETSNIKITWFSEIYSIGDTDDVVFIFNLGQDRQLDQAALGQQLIDAQTAAAEASASATAAATSETNAATSATAAAASASAASVSETNAAASEVAAAGSETAAAASETNAAASATAAAGSATAAAGSAGAASTSETNAAASELAAAASEVNASTAETNAATSATAAAGSASAASTSEANAAASASAASTSETNAAASASAAAASAASIDLSWGNITGTLSAQTDLQTALNAKPNRNLLINGGFDVWQTGTSFAYSVTSGTYAADQWWMTPSGGSTGTFEQSTDAPDGCAYAFYNNTDGSVTLSQPIELLATGAEAPFVAGETVTVSMETKGSGSGAVTMNFRDSKASTTNQAAFTGGGSVTYGASYAKQSVSFTVPSANGTNILANLDVVIPAGCKVSKIQVERGSQATEFERKSIQQTLADCERYLEIDKLFTQPGFVATSVGGTMLYRVTKRIATPTVSASPSYVDANTFQVLVSSDKTAIHWNIKTTGAGGYAVVTLTSNARF